MSQILTSEEWGKGDTDRVQLLWKLFCFARYANDVPEVWKLTKPFLTELQLFLQVPDVDELLSMQFLNAGIDMTSVQPRLVACSKVYSLSLVGYKQDQ